MNTHTRSPMYCYSHPRCGAFIASWSKRLASNETEEGIDRFCIMKYGYGRLATRRTETEEQRQLDERIFCIRYTPMQTQKYTHNL
jgi:hypothetical protein